MISKYMKNRRRRQSGPDLHKQEPTEPSVGTTRGGGWWTLLEVQGAFSSVALGLPGFERAC